MRLRYPRLLALLILSAAALACNFGQSPATPAPVATAAPPEVAPTVLATAPATASPATVPPASPEVPTEFTTYADEDLGLAFTYPAGWALQAGDALVTVASSAELLTATQFDTEGAGVLITAGPDDELFANTDSVQEALVTAIEQSAFAEDQEIVEGPTATTVAGQEAASATVVARDEAGNPTTLFYVTLIRHEGRVALATGVTLAQADAGGDVVGATPYAPTLDEIVSSIRLSRPAGPIVEGSLEYGDSVRGAVPDDGSSVWIFSGSAGERVNLTVEPVAETLDVTVDVLAGDGTSILPEGEVDEAFGTETIQGLELPADDNYIVLLQGFAGSSGDYALTLNAVTAMPEGEALILSLGNTVVGEVESEGADTYLLTEVISRPVTVLVEPDPDFDVVVDLYDAEGGLLESSDVGYEGESERLSFTPLGGTLQVRGFTGTAGGYALTLLDGSPAAAGSTILTAGTLASGDDIHAFPFFAPTGQLVTAYAEPEAEFDLVLEARTGDEEETLLETVDYSFGAEQLNFTTPADGNYFFALYGFDGATGSYTFTLEGTAATIFEVAPGDTVAGRLAEGTILEYTFTLQPGATILLSAAGDAETDVTLAIENPEGNVLAAADDTSAAETETLSFTAPGDGDDLFFLRVQEFGGATGAFTLRLE